MSSALGIDGVGGLLASLEAKEARRLGLSREAARPSLARALRCAPGTLTNIIKGRVKGVRDGLRDRIEDALIRSIRSQMEALKNEEAAILAGSPRRNRQRDLAEIEADLARLKAAFSEGAD